MDQNILDTTLSGYGLNHVDCANEIDEAAVQAKVKEIEEGMHAISAKLYEAAAAEMAEQEESGAEPSDDGVVDADFEVVDEDED